MTTASSRVTIALAALVGAAALLSPVAGASVPAKIALGAKAFAPMGTGFGTTKPKEIFNGGDPSGLVQNISWKHWGSATATATGKTSIFKPHGYYPQLVAAELRASNLGHCTAHGPLAYRRLEAREPSRPGGPLGKWFLWSGQKSICTAPK